MNMYSEEGNDQYEKFKIFCERFAFGYTGSLSIIFEKHETGTDEEKFYDGKFKQSSQGWEKAYDIARKILETGEYHEGYKKRGFICAYLEALNNEKFTHKEFIRALKKRSTEMVECARKEEYLKLIEKIYNYHKPEARRIRIY